MPMACMDWNGFPKLHWSDRIHREKTIWLSNATSSTSTSKKDTTDTIILVNNKNNSITGYFLSIITITIGQNTN